MAGDAAEKCGDRWGVRRACARGACAARAASRAVRAPFCIFLSALPSHFPQPGELHASRLQLPQPCMPRFVFLPALSHIACSRELHALRTQLPQQCVASPKSPCTTSGLSRYARDIRRLAHCSSLRWVHPPLFSMQLAGMQSGCLRGARDVLALQGGARGHLWHQGGCGELNGVLTHGRVLRGRKLSVQRDRMEASCMRQMKGAFKEVYEDDCTCNATTK